MSTKTTKKETGNGTQPMTPEMEQEIKRLEVSMETEASDRMIKALTEGIEGIVKEVADIIQRPIVMNIPNAPSIKIEGTYHKDLPEIIKMINAGVNVFLIGEAGSGKTHLVEQAAESLKKDFYCVSVCYQTSASQLLGYMDAQGKYVTSLFRKAFENGGVFLLDEIDNGNANVLAVINAALSNNYCAFPDKMVEKHKDFILCASGNTFGTGADRRYVGRLEIDGATLDRFVTVPIEYDENLECRICGSEDFAKMIQRARKIMSDRSARHIISPRASIYGTKLFLGGIGIERTLDIVLYKNMDENERNSIQSDSTFNQLKDAVKKITKKAASAKIKDPVSDYAAQYQGVAPEGEVPAKNVARVDALRDVLKAENGDSGKVLKGEIVGDDF